MKSREEISQARNAIRGGKVTKVFQQNKGRKAHKARTWWYVHVSKHDKQKRSRFSPPYGHRNWRPWRVSLSVSQYRRFSTNRYNFLNLPANERELLSMTRKLVFRKRERKDTLFPNASCPNQWIACEACYRWVFWPPFSLRSKRQLCNLFVVINWPLSTRLIPNFSVSLSQFFCNLNHPFVCTYRPNNSPDNVPLLYNQFF